MCHFRSEKVQDCRKEDMGKIIFLFVFSIGSFFLNDAFGQAYLGVKYCEDSLRQCLEQAPGSPQCAQQYSNCLQSQGGLLKRSDGSLSQRYHPENPQFKKCQSQGLATNSNEFANCMNSGTGTTANRPQQPEYDSAPEEMEPAQARSQASESGGRTLQQCQQICLSPGASCQQQNGSYECVGGSGSQQQGSASALSQCQAQYQQLSQKCEAEYMETSRSCDEKNDTGMTSTMSALSQASLLMGQQTASSIAASCSKVAGLTQAANAATAAYRMLCQSAISSCRSTCDELVTFVKQNPACGRDPSLIAQSEDQANQCLNFDSKMQEAQAAVQNFAATAANASQCASLTAGDIEVPQICLSNPTLPGCSTITASDCSKPEMASNKICVCSRNPTDPTCVGLKSTGDAALASSTLTSRLNGSGANAGGLDIGDIPDLPSIEHGQVKGGGGTGVDGKQGAGANLGSSDMGGAAAGGPGGGGGAYGDEAGHDVNAGFYGGGGGGAFGTNGRSYGATGGGAGGYGANGQAARGNGVNLRQFLPGGKFDPRARGIAGASGPDGITGPHSNIWQKIQNRYKVLSPTLMP